jgi:hypothetical protein
VRPCPKQRENQHQRIKEKKLNDNIKHPTNPLSDITRIVRLLPSQTRTNPAKLEWGRRELISTVQRSRRLIYGGKP